MDVNVKLSLFILSPNPGAANQTLPLPSCAAGLLWFGIRGVGLLAGDQESTPGSALPLLALPFTLASGQNLLLPEQIFSVRKMASLDTASLLYSSGDSSGTVGYSMVFVPDGTFSSTTSLAILLKVIHFFPEDKFHCLVHSGLDKRFTRNFNIK